MGLDALASATSGVDCCILFT